jgi:hypothetical protein
MSAPTGAGGKLRCYVIVVVPRRLRGATQHEKRAELLRGQTALPVTLWQQAQQAQIMSNTNHERGAQAPSSGASRIALFVISDDGGKRSGPWAKKKTTKMRR